MANDCLYEMQIRGSKRAIARVIACLKADYNYTEKKPAHKHFFRVFDCYDDSELNDNGDGTFTKYVYGYCAWSVHSCMMGNEGELSCYNMCKENYKDIFMGTTLEEQSKDCIIEVFSEEPGMAFSEHYIYNHGVCECDTCIEIQEGGYDQKGNPTTDIDWDTYEGDTITFNDNRRGFDGEFMWGV